MRVKSFRRYKALKIVPSASKSPTNVTFLNVERRKVLLLTRGEVKSNLVGHS